MARIDRRSPGPIRPTRPVMVPNPAHFAPLRMQMPRLVMKFGGTSVANVERIRNVARHVRREVEAGYDVAVVVSAMAGKTNELVAWCKEASPLHDPREYDRSEEHTSELQSRVDISDAVFCL